MTSATRQRVPGIRPEDHTYAGPDGDGIGMAPGTLTGVTWRRGETVCLIGPHAMDLDTGIVTEWMISDGSGWINGPTWPTVEAAVDAAADDQTRAALREYADTVSRAWDLRREARELDERAQQLLAAIEAPCVESGRRRRPERPGPGVRAQRNQQVDLTCSACGFTDKVKTDRNGWAVTPRHARKGADSE